MKLLNKFVLMTIVFLTINTFAGTTMTLTSDVVANEKSSPELQDSGYGVTIRFKVSKLSLLLANNAQCNLYAHSAKPTIFPRGLQMKVALQDEHRPEDHRSFHPLNPVISRNVVLVGRPSPDSYIQLTCSDESYFSTNLYDFDHPGINQVTENVVVVEEEEMN